VPPATGPPVQAIGPAGQAGAGPRRLSVSVLATSTAAGRYRGSFCSSLPSAGSRPPARTGGGGLPVRIPDTTEVMFGPSNGRLPSTAAYRVAPSDHMSASGPASSPSSCSGAM
jgi:hypothetical protein